jgi:hypothetical protein
LYLPNFVLKSKLLIKSSRGQPSCSPKKNIDLLINADELKPNTAPLDFQGELLAAAAAPETKQQQCGLQRCVTTHQFRCWMSTV